MGQRCPVDRIAHNSESSEDWSKRTTPPQLQHEILRPEIKAIKYWQMGLESNHAWNIHPRQERAVLVRSMQSAAALP